MNLEPADVPKLKATLERWRQDPVAFVLEAFGPFYERAYGRPLQIDGWQQEVLGALLTHRKIALQACKGPGKSCVLAWSIWWFLITRRHPNVIGTSITAKNLEDGLWKELAVWFRFSPLLQSVFEFTSERIFAKQHKKTWWCSARSFPQDADKMQQANTIAGLHTESVMAVLDEVGSYPPGVLVAAEAIGANDVDWLLLVAGNPTDVNGPLFQIATNERAHWFVKEITGDPDDPMCAPRIDKAWAREAIAKHGWDSAYVRINVRGLFPLTGNMKLLGPHEVSAAMAREPGRREYEDEPIAFGLDVASDGAASSVLTRRQGNVVFQMRQWRIEKADHLADQVASELNTFPTYAVVFIDVSGGWGRQVRVRLMDLGFENIIGVDFAGSALDSWFLNKRAEMYWTAAEWVKGGGSLPKDSELHSELTAPDFQYKTGAGKQTRYAIEPKVDIIARLGRSPDKADSFILTFGGPVARRENPLLVNRAAAAVTQTDFDPWAHLEGAA